MKSVSPDKGGVEEDGVSPSNEAHYTQEETNLPDGSLQVLDLMSADPTYHHRYMQCVSDYLKLDTDASLVHSGQKGKGYVEEHTSWRGMRQRAKLKNLPISPEFTSFRFFLLHVGPKYHYASTNPLSIDRINTGGGYTIGNVRWADKLEQTQNRRTSKFHLVEGRQVSDQQLADLLTERSGTKVSRETVKKRRQRGLSTKDQFVHSKVPYTSGGSAVYDWKFPQEYQDMEATYLVERRRNESRIEFFVRRLRGKIDALHQIKDTLTATLGQRQKAREQIADYQKELEPVWQRLKELRIAEHERVLQPLYSEKTRALIKQQLPKPAGDDYDELDMHF